MSPLALAMADGRWELVSLSLLLGLLRAWQQVPEDSVEGLLDLLVSYGG